jgi:hypothetical protein
MKLVTEAPAPLQPHEDAGPAGGARGLLWLTWRQHRWALLGTLVLSAALVGWMIFLSVDLTTLWRECHHAYCPEHSPQGDRLAGSSRLVLMLDAESRLVQFTPLLIGLFVGVPVLAREHEQRTLVLAWSQDVSPNRWLWTKLGLLGLFVAGVTAVIAGVSDHLEHLETQVARGSLFSYLPFLNTGMLPVVISVCWFVVGAALGAAIRRTLPAVFAVIAGFIGLTYLVQWRYPTLVKPLFAQVPAGRVLLGNALIVHGGMIQYGDGPSNLFEPSGHSLSGAELLHLCPPENDGGGRMAACFTDHRLELHLQYQPGSRIPEFHLLVAAGYLGLTALALVALWWMVRRTQLSAG